MSAPPVVDVLIAGPVSYFSDDIATACGTCGVKLFKRPHAPEAERTSCLACASADVQDGKPFEIVTSPLALRDAIQYLAATSNGGH